MTDYNPYTPLAVAEWHQELSNHVGWHVRHVVDYFLERGYTELKMLDVGCCTGRLVELMNKRLPITEAVLVDVVPELIDHAHSLFGDKYSYEACALGNRAGTTNLTLPQRTKIDGTNSYTTNLGGATVRKESSHMRYGVPINTFDNIWKERYRGFEPDLIKVDAEGQDINVLQGMEEFITSLSKKPLIVYEIAGGNLSEEEVKDVYDRLSFLTDMGYTPVWEDSLAPKKSCDLVIGIEDEIKRTPIK